MPSTMVDTAAPPRLKHTGRRHLSASTALSNANAGGGSVAAAHSNANAGAVAVATKPKAKAVASRYLAPFSKPASISSSSRRSASPAPRQPASAEGVLPPNAVAAAASNGGPAVTTRTLSVAFQSPTYCLDTSRSARSVSPAAAAAITPEKRRTGTAGAAMRGKVSDAGQNTYLWPASATTAPCGHGAGVLARRLDYAASNRKQSAAIFATARPKAFDGTPRRASVDGVNEYLMALSSDTDSTSASSGGSRDGGAADRPGVACGPRSTSPGSIRSSSARFNRDAVGTRSDRFAYPGSQLSSRAPAATSPSPVKKRSLLNGLLSSPFRKPSPKQSSPSKLAANSLKTTASPSQARRSTETPYLAVKLQGKASSTDCNLDSDIKLKPPGATKAEEEHKLKLLYTQHLQWRYANAKNAAALSSQKKAAEKALSGAWITILRMRKLVTMRKLQLQMFRNNCKLMAILRGQMMYLEQWSSLERDYAISLSGTTVALNATVLRLPVSDGAMADIQALKNAVGSAIDLMQTIGNSTSTQILKLVRTNVLVSQLSRVVNQELILMAQCRELLSTLASMHVTYSSLQGQRIQLTQRRLRRA